MNNEPQDIDYESNPEDEECAPTQEVDVSLHEDQNVSQTYSSIYSSGNIADDIRMVNDGRLFFCNQLQSPIDRLFTIMSALTIAISCSHNREYLLEALENYIVECESYYSNHIQLFSNIISMGRELLNSERQSGWEDVQS
jgi:hypothetical protein